MTATIPRHRRRYPPTGNPGDPGFRYAVSMAGFYNTSYGARVGGTRRRRFTDLDTARAYANEVYSQMIGKGWTRARQR